MISDELKQIVDKFNEQGDLEPFIIELKKRKNKMSNAYGEIVSLPFNNLIDKLDKSPVFHHYLYFCCYILHYNFL